LAAKLENLSVQLADSKAASFLQTHTHGKKTGNLSFILYYWCTQWVWSARDDTTRKLHIPLFSRVLWHLRIQ